VRRISPYATRVINFIAENMLVEGIGINGCGAVMRVITTRGDRQQDQDIDLIFDTMAEQEAAAPQLLTEMQAAIEEYITDPNLERAREDARLGRGLARAYLTYRGEPLPAVVAAPPPALRPVPQPQPPAAAAPAREIHRGWFQNRVMGCDIRGLIRLLSNDSMMSRLRDEGWDAIITRANQ
jgi:hypothetical protein